MTSVRFAEEKDLPIILHFIRELADFEKLAHEVKVDPETLRKNLFGSKKYAEVLLAENESQPIGFAIFFHNFSTFLGKPGVYLEDLYVNPESRGTGAGKLLLKKLAEIALERGCGRLEWWVLDWNEKAIRFYESIGAKPMSDWTVYRMTENEMKNLAQSS